MDHADKYGWLVSNRGVLHFVRGVTGKTWDQWDGVAPPISSSACGRSLRLDMPGVCDRIGAPRCAACCRIVAVPAGFGAPINGH